MTHNSFLLKYARAFDGGAISALVLGLSTNGFIKCIRADKSVSPLYTGGLFHFYMLDVSICHFRVVGFIFSLLFNF